MSSRQTRVFYFLRSQSFALAVVVALLLAAALVFTTSHFPFRSVPDALQYRDLAEFGVSAAHRPFATRILLPTLAGFAASASGLTLDTSFLILTLASLVILVLVIAILNRDSGIDPLYSVLLCSTPVILVFWHGLFLPDAFHACLLAIFFLALSRNRTAIACTLIPIMFLTRESTLLLGLVFAVLAWPKRKRLSYSILLITAGSALLSAFVTRKASAGVSGLGFLAYLTAKVPYYTLRNIIGLAFYPNTLRPFGGVCLSSPFWTIRGLHIGLITSIDFCGFDFLQPLQTAVIFLTTFGPLLLLLHPKFRARSIRPGETPFYLNLALVYGVACFLLGRSSELPSIAWLHTAGRHFGCLLQAACNSLPSATPGRGWPHISVYAGPPNSGAP